MPSRAASERSRGAIAGVPSSPSPHRRAVPSSPSRHHRPVIAVPSSPSRHHRPVIAVPSSPSRHRGAGIAVATSPWRHRRAVIGRASSLGRGLGQSPSSRQPSVHHAYLAFRASSDHSAHSVLAQRAAAPRSLSGPRASRVAYRPTAIVRPRASSHRVPSYRHHHASRFVAYCCRATIIVTPRASSHCGAAPAVTLTLVLRCTRGTRSSVARVHRRVVAAVMRRASSHRSASSW